jgi:hypothetical protein
MQYLSYLYWNTFYNYTLFKNKTDIKFKSKNTNTLVHKHIVFL